MRLSVCGGWSAYTHERGALKVVTLWCRSWLCPDCAPYRVGGLKRMAVDGKPTTFLTLTVNPAIGESADARAQGLSNAFKILIKRARRKFSKCPLEYLAVFEETKRGEPHLHILMRAPFIPQKWLSETMAELISSPIVDIRKVGHVRNAARYIAKYIAKGPKPFAALKRYWHSKGWLEDGAGRDRRPAEERQQWAVMRDPAFWVAEQFARLVNGIVCPDGHDVYYVFTEPPWNP